MTKFWVAFKSENQSEVQDLQLEVDEPALSCDIVLRALGRHLNPSEEWPFAVDRADCSIDADIGERAVRLNRAQAARKHLKLVYLSYRPEGTVLQFSC